MRPFLSGSYKQITATMHHLVMMWKQKIKIAQSARRLFKKPNCDLLCTLDAWLPRGSRWVNDLRPSSCFHVDYTVHRVTSRDDNAQVKQRTQCTATHASCKREYESVFVYLFVAIGWRPVQDIICLFSKLSWQKLQLTHNPNEHKR